ncbi:hypothetical protein PINS_up019301 [Pythium insidiosum]|nr:hypothetical protein PINS_up019301 [Pythium insidiosum]
MMRRSTGSTLWRVTRPLFAAGSTSARSTAATPRRFIGYSVARFEPVTRDSSTIPTASATAATETVTSASPITSTEIPSSTPAKAVVDAAPEVDEAENVVVDLSDVGAETTKVLTIADVLSKREEELAAQGSAAMYFDEWESIPAKHTIQDAVDMMVESNMGSLIVTEENEGIVGIVTERDVLKKTSPRTIHEDQLKAVRDIMSSQIMCIPPSTTVIDALATMTKENIRHLAVINGEISNAVKKGSVPEEAMRCVLSIKDIVKAYSKFEAQKKSAQQQQQQQQQQTEATESPSEAAPAAPAAAATPAAEPAAAPVAGEATADAKPEPETAPVVTAATLLKKKHKKVKLILNTRAEDNITVADAVEAMARHDFGSVLVVDKEQRVLGIFTERDYLTKVLYPKQDPTRLKMVDVATKKLSCLQIEDTLEDCWDHAAANSFRHYPVIGTMRKDREKELAGILSIKDIVREISKGHETQSGFRLMDFFKSKMEKKEPAVAATPTPTPTPTAAPAAASTPAPADVAGTSSPTAVPATPEAAAPAEPTSAKKE